VYAIPTKLPGIRTMLLYLVRESRTCTTERTGKNARARENPFEMVGLPCGFICSLFSSMVLPVGQLLNAFDGEPVSLNYSNALGAK
jgi:hypothetical protein